MPCRLAVLTAFAALFGSTPAISQTLDQGLDNPAILTPITTKSALIDGTNFPVGEWVYTTGTTHDGVDAITSTLPNRSSSEINTTVQGPATVSFWWRMRGVQYFDSFQFSSRNDFALRQPDMQGNADWQQVNVQVDTGSQPLNWYFERLSNTPVGTEQAWLDELVITPIPNNPALQAAVENYAYSLHSTDWTSSPFDGAQNSTVAKSGEIEQNQKSTMVFEVEGPATLKYHWGIAADESDLSTMAIQVNNQTISSISGPQGLSEVSLDLGPGTHAMKFTFQRGHNSNPEYTGPTEGFVDRLEITPFGASPELADAVERPGGVYSNSWIRQTQVVRDGNDAAMVTAPEVYKARRIYVKLPDEPGLLSFWYKMEADAMGYIFATVDGETLLNTSGAKDWTKVEMNLGTGSDRVLQAYFIRYNEVNANSPNTKAFLDEFTFTPGATNYQPDLSIGPLKKGMKGIGRHNSTGANQIATIRAPLSRPVGEFAIRSQNGSSTDQDRIALRGVGNRRHFQIYYVVEEGGQKLNYSAAFAAGRFETTLLNPNESEAHEIWVAPKRKKLKKRSHVLRIIGTSDADPRKTDVVRTKLIVKKR